MKPQLAASLASSYMSVKALQRQKHELEQDLAHLQNLSAFRERRSKNIGWKSSAPVFDVISQDFSSEVSINHPHDAVEEELKENEIINRPSSIYDSGKVVTVTDVTPLNQEYFYRQREEEGGNIIIQIDDLDQNDNYSSLHSLPSIKDSNTERNLLNNRLILENKHDLVERETRKEHQESLERQKANAHQNRVFLNEITSNEEDALSINNETAAQFMINDINILETPPSQKINTEKSNSQLHPISSNPRIIKSNTLLGQEFSQLTQRNNLTTYFPPFTETPRQLEAKIQTKEHIIGGDAIQASLTRDSIFWDQQTLLHLSQIMPHANDNHTNMNEDQQNQHRIQRSINYRQITPQMQAQHEHPFIYHQDQHKGEQFDKSLEVFETPSREETSICSIMNINPILERADEQLMKNDDITSHEEEVNVIEGPTQVLVKQIQAAALEEQKPLPGLFSLLNKKPMKLPMKPQPSQTILEKVQEKKTDDPVEQNDVKKMLGEAFRKQISAQQDLSLLDCLMCRCQKKRQILGKYTDKSLMIFTETNCARAATIQIIESKAFEYVMITVIILNSILLSLIDYKDRDSLTVYNKTLDKISILFTASFICEAGFKIFAQGLLLHQNAYLRSGWNLIDCIVVIFGIIEISAGTLSLKSLRIVRIFRPLKSLNAISTIKKLISALINSLPDFANIIFFQIFVFILFATIGLHQYNGAYYNACRETATPQGNHWPFDYSYDRLCTVSGSGNFQCPAPQFCANPEDYPQVDLDTERMFERGIVNYGVTNYDNIGRALLAVFQIVTSDTWYQQLCNLMDADYPWFGALYCLLMIIIGQFFLMSLILAVIIYSFINSQKKELQREIEEFQREQELLEDQMNVKPEDKGEVPDPLLEILEMNLESIENISDENIIEQGQHGPIIKKKKKKRRNQFKKKLTSKSRSSIIKRANTLDFQNKEDSIDSSNSSESNQESSSKVAFEEVKIGGFLKDQAIKRKVVNIFQSKMSEIPEIKNDNDSGHEQDRVEEIKVDMNKDRRKFSKQSLRFTQPIVKQKNYKKSKFFKKPKNKEDEKLNDLDDIFQSNSDIAENTPDIQQEQEIVEQESILDQELDKSSSIKETLSNCPKISTAKISFLQRPTLQCKKQSTINASAGLLKLQLLQNHDQNQMEMTEEESNGFQSIDNRIFMKASSLRTSDSRGAMLFKKVFKQYIENKIQHEYEDYFKAVLKEAQQNQNQNNANMREIVGIKVGLEYMKGKDAEQERQLEKQMSIDMRKKNSTIFRYAILIMNSPAFIRLMTFAIIVNTVILSLDKYPIDQETNYVVEKLNILFTTIFIIELGIRLTALGIKNYYKGQWFHVFDTVIVIASAIDLVVSQVLNSIEDQDKIYRGSAITALRAIRIMRVLKLSREWKRFELLLETMGNTLKDVASFSFLLFLFTFIFTLLGLELFAYKAMLDPETNFVDLENGVSPTFNFDTFMNSFSLVFIILTNDGQAAIYYNHYRSVTSWGSTIFWVLLVIVGQKIILNLFVAILLENFDEGALKQKMHDYEQAQLEQGIAHQQSKVVLWAKAKWESTVNWFNQIVFKKKHINSISNPKKMISLQRKLNLGLKMEEKKEAKIRARLEEEKQNETLTGKSLLMFPSSGKFRKVLLTIVTNNKFDIFIVLVILLSSLELALNGPLLDPKSDYLKTLSKIDLATTIIFISECLMKIVTFGFLFNGKNSYLRKPWNVLDFIIVILSIISQSSLSNDFKVIKVLRILRLISRHQGLKVAVRALYYALPNILNVTVIMLIFFLIFGVIGVSQFKGKFYFCAEDLSTQQQISQKWDCLNAGGIWDSHVYTFDDIPNAMITLFVMSTTAGWQDVLINGITSTDIDYVHQEYRDPFWTIFFILFMVIGFFFFLNLFIGVVVTTFNSEHDRLGGNDLLTEKQREWIDLKLLILRAAPIKRMTPLGSKISKICFKIVSHPWFEKFIQISIIVNSICLIMKWYQQPLQMVQALEIVNYIFTSIFLAEALVKLLAWGIKQYFNDEWNIFDFFVALGSLIGVILQMFDLKFGIKGVATVLRSFRVFRLVRLLRRGGRNLYMIFNTFVITITSLSNIGALLLLIIFMYSVLGMILLGHVKRNGLMNAYMNFENFWNAFITLFTVTTGDSWNATQTSFVLWPSPNNECIWHPSYQDYLDAGETVGCGDRITAYAFFTSYTFVVNLIFLQLFIAVILQGYDHTQVQEARLFNNEMSRVFRQKWSDFDPQATTFIYLKQLRELLFALGDPLGFDESYRDQPELQTNFIASLELPIYNNFTQYQFLDVLDALSFRIMVIDQLRAQEVARQQSVPKNTTKTLEIGQVKDDQTKSQENNQIPSDYVMPNGPLSIQFRIALEKKVKQELQQEMNKLLFQKKLEKISAVQDMINKEKEKQKQQKSGISAVDGNGVPLHYFTGFTSQHHMAAEATVRKMKQFLKIRRRENKRTQRILEEDINLAQIMFKQKQTHSGPTNFNTERIIKDKIFDEIVQDNSAARNAKIKEIYDDDSVSSFSQQQSFYQFDKKSFKL